MTISAHDVAREIRDRIPSVGVVKLHKLLYYCQGWHLAHYGEPMFTEELAAWVNGPVVKSLWTTEKHQPTTTPTPLPLRASHSDIVGYVVGRYGGLTGRDLIRLSHEELPWRQVAESEDLDGSTSPTIDLCAISEFFSSDSQYRAAINGARSDKIILSPTQPDDFVVEHARSLAG